MFIVLVKFEAKRGRYPLVFLNGQYVVSENTYNNWSNVGSVLTAEAVQKEIGKVLGSPDILGVEIQSV